MANAVDGPRIRSAAMLHFGRRMGTSLESSQFAPNPGPSQGSKRAKSRETLSANIKAYTHAAACRVHPQQMRERLVVAPILDGRRALARANHRCYPQMRHARGGERRRDRLRHSALGALAARVGLALGLRDGAQRRSAAD